MEESIEDQVISDVARLNEKMFSGSTVRSKIINKLSESLDKMSIDPNNENSKALDAKMNLINTLLKTVNDEESQHISAIKLKQSIKRDKESADTLASIGNIVAEYIKNIKPPVLTQNTDTGGKNDDVLEEAIENEGFEILDGELEITSQLTEVDND
jgi:hypothetical protein